MACDHKLLASLKPQSYVTSLVHTTAKLGLTDTEMWNSLASYVA